MGYGGRPRIFESPEELQKRLEEYFESCFDESWYQEFTEDGTKRWVPELDRHGKVVKYQKEPFTVSGLAVFLGIDRKTLLNYAEREEFFLTIRNAKAKIEAYTEKQLYDKAAKNITGLIFNLKVNYGWIDKQEMDLTVGNRQGESFNVSNSVKELTVEELRKLAQSKPDGDYTA